MEFNVAFFISQGLSAVAAISSIFAEQIKTMKGILLAQTFVNLVAALSYLFLVGGQAGFIVSMIGTIQSISMYFYDKKGKKPHFTVSIAFIAAYVFLSLYNNTDRLINFLPAAAAVCFTLAVMQKKPKSTACLTVPMRHCGWFTKFAYCRATSSFILALRCPLLLV